MYHVLLRDASFWDSLFRVDENLAAQARQQGCSCGRRLQCANCRRKPRCQARRSQTRKQEPAPPQNATPETDLED